MSDNDPSRESKPLSSVDVLLQVPLVEPFEPLPAGIIAPHAYVPIEVATSAVPKFRSLNFVVDTGASISAIPIWLADENHIPYRTTKKRHVPIQGIAGTIERSFLNDVEIRIGKVVVTIPCLFFESPFEQGPAFLGRAGVLWEFDISFVEFHVVITRRRRVARS